MHDGLPPFAEKGPVKYSHLASSAGLRRDKKMRADGLDSGHFLELLLSQWALKLYQVSLHVTLPFCQLSTLLMANGNCARQCCVSNP